MASSLPTFAACVSIPSCHFGTTKTNRKTSMIMARTTQHDELASCVFASPPSVLIQRNGVTIRRGLKPTVNAVPRMVEIPTEGIPVKTITQITNDDIKLNLIGHTSWEGSKKDIVETVTDDKKSRTFTHDADPGDPSQVLGSAGAVHYLIGDDQSNNFIVAWANSRNIRNKVYAIITDKRVNWDDIKVQVYKSEHTTDGGDKGYKFSAEINEEAAAPTLKVTLTLDGLDQPESKDPKPGPEK